LGIQASVKNKNNLETTPAFVASWKGNICPEDGEQTVRNLLSKTMR